jgi:hypothetical protein
MEGDGRRYTSGFSGPAAASPGARLSRKATRSSSCEGLVGAATRVPSANIATIIASRIRSEWFGPAPCSVQP